MRLADRLAAARRRGFVGRGAQLDRFIELVARVDTPRVVFVHGPGGVGKTALLYQYAWLAEREGRRCVWLDGAETPPVAGAVLGLLGAELGTDEPLAALERMPGLVLLVDGAEALGPLDRWLREELIPRLPADAIVVLSGRERPSPAWWADPGWRDLAR